MYGGLWQPAELSLSPVLHGIAHSLAIPGVGVGGCNLSRLLRPTVGTPVPLAVDGSITHHKASEIEPKWN